jgi:uncharacterized protein (TIGR03790 family)
MLHHGQTRQMPFCGSRWLAASAVFLSLLAGAARPAQAGGSDLASRVVILANASDPDSVRLARYYAAKRAVPPVNLVALPMPLVETISWPEFIGSVYQPLQDWLVARGWIDAIGTTLTDGIGRKRYSIFGHHISYLVVCKGVPLCVSHEPRFFVDAPGLASRPMFRTNQGAVDSELTLLAHGTYNINGWVPNPRFGIEQARLFEAEPVVIVTRLDGPAYEDAAGLVDHAIEAETTGLIGRFYVNIRGPHPDGERWLDQTAAQLADLGFDGDVDRTDNNLPATARFDAPALYFGWYAQDLSGPMALPGFRFPPGAIALHIHSFSAHTLRSAVSGWCGPLVARGVTATFGNVFEPYLQLTIEPQLLMRALRQGRNLGDAACYATPALSWQTIVIGDPLYRPFAVPLDAQLARVGVLPPALAPYVLLRKARLLERGEKRAEAVQLLQEGLHRQPSLVLALALAERLAAGGDKAGAARILTSLFEGQSLDTGQTPLAQRAARLLLDCGAAPQAVAVYRAILGNAALEQGWRATILRDATDAARAAGEQDQEAAWQMELAGSASPPPLSGKK